MRTSSREVLVLICMFIAASALARSPRLRRAAYELPAGAKELLGKDIKTSFKCEFDGYYADIDNDCKIFHRCDSSAGKKMQHHSFICGENTQFDQSDLTCKRTDDAIPCEASTDFFNLNERIGKDGPFLTPADLEKAKNARPEYRARAK